jgi:hypothetical protein
LAGWLPLVVLVLETGRVSERLRVREIDDDEGRRLVRIVRRGSGSVVTWRRAQMPAFRRCDRAWCPDLLPELGECVLGW